MEVAGRGFRIRGRGGKVPAAALQDGAKGVKRGGEVARNRDGGARALRARQESGADPGDELLDVLAVGRAEGHGVDNDFRTIGPAHAANQKRLVEYAAAGRRGGREVQQQRSAPAGIDGQIVAGGMNGIALERAEVRRDGFQPQHGGPRRQAMANLVVERLALGLLEDQDGQLGRLGGPQRQVERDGCHGSTEAI